MSDRLISLDKLLKDFKNDLDCYGESEEVKMKSYVQVCDIINMINSQPIVREDKWISVKDSLPNVTGEYLCCYIFERNVDLKYYQVLHFYATDEIPHFQHELGDKGMHVTHWQPISEPVKEND